MHEPRRLAMKKKRGLRTARRIVLLVLILCLIALSSVYRKDLNMNNFRRLMSYIDIGGTRGPATENVTIRYGAVTGAVCGAYKNNVVVLSNEFLRIYDNLGKERASIVTGYSNPALEPSGKYLLVYDRGGSKLSVINGTREIYSKVFDNAIISAAINDSGFIGVITKAQGFKAMITVFDSSFNELYRCYSFDNYVLDLAISPDNEHMSLLSLNSRDGMLISTVSIYSFLSDKPTSVKSYDDKALYKIGYMGAKKIVALGEESILFFDNEGEEQNRFSFNGAKPLSYSIDSRRAVVMVLKNYAPGSRGTVIKLDEDGNTLFETPVSYEIKEVYAFSGSVFVLSQNACSVYSENGELKKTLPLSNDVRQVLALGNAEILLISPTMVKIAKID